MLHEELQHLPGLVRKRIEMPRRVSMRLNRLERPVPWPEELVAEIRERCPADLVQQYPNYPQFYRRLAAFTAQREENLVVGAGIEEFIRILMAACFGQKVAVLWPSCAMFDVYADAFKIDLQRIQTNPQVRLSVDDVCRAVGPDTRVLLLANPGQPVETVFWWNELREIAKHCAKNDCLLAIDEAYHGFGANTAISLPERACNVVVLRTFSKALGAAGIRLGYAVGGPFTAPVLNAVRQSGEVSSLSMAVATVLMDRYHDLVRPAITDVVLGRIWLRNAFLTAGYQAWGEHANHVLVAVGTDLGRKAKMLEAEGILVRVCPDPLDGYMLVTAGPQPMMERFFEAFLAA